MADIDIATEFVLRQEDADLAGVITNDPRDSGGRTRFGVAERWHPELTKTGFFDSMDRDEALNIAKDVYAETYASPLNVPELKSQDVANALMSFGVNEGPSTSIKVLQKVLGLDPDGKFGPITLARVNSCTSSSLLKALASGQQLHYMDIAASDPSQNRFLKGWINRIHKACLIT